MVWDLNTWPRGTRFDPGADGLGTTLRSAGWTRPRASRLTAQQFLLSTPARESDGAVSDVTGPR